jgi:spore germination protein YaaH
MPGRKIPVLLLALMACLGIALSAQEKSYIGIHQVESEYYSRIFDTITSVVSVSPMASVTPAAPVAPGANVALKGRTDGDPAFMVYGWHPYWAGAAAYPKYNYDVLTHIAYFSYEVDTATGSFTTLRGWDTISIVNYSHQRGIKVMLTVTNFGTERNTKILTDTVKQWTLINTVIAQLKARNGDGVNFDFESVPSAMKTNMVSFCRRAVRGIKAELPLAEISLATPAVNWSDGWDLGALAGICDYLIMMGYNYYWGGSATAGPVAPLDGENYDVTRSIQEDYLDEGVPASKLLLGMPWYGYDWPVNSSARKATTTGTGTSKTYITTLQMVLNYGKTFDNETSVPWTSYQNGTQWRQMWFEDSLSLLRKAYHAKKKNLAGVGIWALSYEAGRPELWNGLKAVIAGTVSSEGNPAIPGSGGSEILSIVPNPVSDKALISYIITRPGRMTLTILDSGGRPVILLTEGTVPPGIHSNTLAAEGLAPGIYFCVMNTPGGRSVKKFAVTGK